MYNLTCTCGCSSPGRAQPCQGWGSEFEPRHPLHKKERYHLWYLSFLYSIIKRLEQGNLRRQIETIRWIVSVPACVPTKALAFDGRASARRKKFRVWINFCEIYNKHISYHLLRNSTLYCFSQIHKWIWSHMSLVLRTIHSFSPKSLRFPRTHYKKGLGIRINLRISNPLFFISITFERFV